MTQIRTPLSARSTPPRRTPAQSSDDGVFSDATPDLTPPKHRGFHTIPASHVLLELIDRAVSALKQGIYWDRGSILNVEV